MAALSSHCAAAPTLAATAYASSAPACASVAPRLREDVTMDDRVSSPPVIGERREAEQDRHPVTEIPRRMATLQEPSVDTQKRPLVDG